MRKGGTSAASHKEKMVRSVDNCDETVWSADCPEECPPDCKRPDVWKKTKKSASDCKARLAQTARLMPTTIKPQEEAATVKAPAAQLESEVGEAMKKFSIRALLVSMLMLVVVSISMGVYALVMVVGGRGSEQAPSWVNITLFGFTSLVMASAILLVISFRREIWEALRDMWRISGV